MSTLKQTDKNAYNLLIIRANKLIKNASLRPQKYQVLETEKNNNFLCPDTLSIGEENFNGI